MQKQRRQSINRKRLGKKRRSKSKASEQLKNEQVDEEASHHLLTITERTFEESALDI